MPPQRPRLPAVRNEKWARNPIDRFVLARLEREGLKPSPEADRATLLRRLSFDLTGLPPTPAELDAFLADKSPDAYEKQVDRLLACPHYGERMAMQWLDLARYADTHGYHIDSQRDMWQWRDWVIDAFNRNMPFDRFAIEQLAGDLLPNATVEQKLASGFNRNHMINYEGGAIPEEYQVEYVADRVDTTANVFMGLTRRAARAATITSTIRSRRRTTTASSPSSTPIAEKGLDGADGQRRADPRNAHRRAGEPGRVAAAVHRRPSRPRCRRRTRRRCSTAGRRRGWRPCPKRLRDGLLAHYALDGNLADTLRQSSATRAR